MAETAFTTVSPEEIARFQAMADAWWDTEGDFKPLHHINSPRLAFLCERLGEHFGRDPKIPRPFEGLSLLDIGCGGGLLCEPLARLGFQVTGIDAGEKTIGIARVHAQQSGLDIVYRTISPEQMDGQFDVVLTMEVVEHVPDIGKFLTVAGERLKKGGAFAGSTLNRTPKSYALAIVGAEYILRWLPCGTHDWKKFVRPSEFSAALRYGGITVTSFSGLQLNVLRNQWVLNDCLDVNYLVFGVKD